MEDTFQRKELDLLTDLAYCLIHGIVLFSISYIFFLMWYLPRQFTIYIASVTWFSVSALFISFLGIGLALLLAGAVNVTVAGHLWTIKTRSNGRIFMAEGLILVIVTQVLLLPLPSIQTILFRMEITLQAFFVVLIFIDYCLAFGIIGRKTAGIYSQPLMLVERMSREKKPVRFSGTRARCPYCHASFRYRDYDRGLDGTVKCYRCSRLFYMEPIDDLLKKLGENIDVNSRIDL
jgi:predicted Zn finger-like uncharacterized protein